MFRSLRNRNYRLYASGQAISNTGTWMQRVAQDWLVLELSHGSGTALGVTTALQFLPMLLFGLWGGVIADRYRKRRLLLMTQSGLGLVALTLGVLVLSGLAQVWHVYLLSFALGMVAAIDIPTRQSFVVEMVGSQHLPNAIALNAAIFNSARVTGPAVAGLLIHVIGGTGPVFLINAASVGAVLTGLALMRDLRTPEPVPRAKGQLREGLRYVRGNPALLLPIMLVAVTGLFGMNVTVLLALMAKGEFRVDAGAFGLASSALAIGALSGALLSARRNRPSRRVLIGSALGFGGLLAISGLAPTYPLFLVALVPAGTLLISLNTTANATVQLASDPAMRGRVMSLYVLLFMGGTPFAAVVIGRLAELAGPRTAMVSCGVAALVGTLMALAVARRRTVPMTGGHADVRLEA